MTVNKDSFESFKAGLFICNKANEAEVCVILFTETSLKKRRWRIWTGTGLKEIVSSILQKKWEPAS